MDAKDYQKLQHSAKKVNRDDAFHFQFEKDQDYVQFLINDAMRSMIEKVKKTGTSQDPEEWTDPPEYSDYHIRKNFVMVVVKFRNKFRGIARSMDDQFDLKTDWFTDKNKAGQQIVKYIDLFRNQANMKRLNDLVEQRNRASERKKLIV